MTENPSTQPAAPPPCVLALFQRAGWRQFLGSGTQAWWTNGKSDPIVWQDAVTRIGDELLSLRAMQARLPESAQKPFWRTSEFWVSFSGTGAAAAAGLTQLMSSAETLPPPYNHVLGVLCMLLGPAMGIGYAYARNMAKVAAAAEGQKQLEESKTDPDLKQS